MCTKKIKFYSPEIDNIVESNSNITFSSINKDHSYESEKAADILQNIFNLIQQIKPKEKGKDKIWSLWLKSERGPLSAFVNDEEYNELKEIGEVENFEDLQVLWKSYYPEKIKWYNASFLFYERDFLVIFDTKLQVKINFDTKELTGSRLEDDEEIKFLTWLSTEIEHEVNTFRKNPDTYNRSLSKNLPFYKRFGKIKRITLWQNVKDISRLDEELGPYNLKKFEKVADAIKEEKSIKEMTADVYFRYCEICYDANDYFQDSDCFSPRDKYKKMADGRDEELLEIQGDSQKVFSEWYENRFHIGHPWEICRGGNSTHISFMVCRDRGGWRVYLNGSSRARVVETAKMAVALFEHKIPFILVDAEQMVNMLKGDDYLGIVPEDIIPKYCHSHFPDEDQIHDFINPWHDKDVVKAIEKYAKWYPVETLEIMNQ